MGSNELEQTSREDEDKTVLIVDDEQANLTLLYRLIRAEGYHCVSAMSGQQALDVAHEQAPDLILLDIMMPDMDGLEVTRRLKEDPATKNIPIILVTALSDRQTKLSGLSAGAEDFISKPIDRLEVQLRVRNFLRIKAYHDLLNNFNQQLTDEVMKKTGELNGSYLETLFTLARAAEYKDTETGAHIQRIRHYSDFLAKEQGCNVEFVTKIFNASILHDVGKIGIPDQVLLKPARLTPEEMTIMKSHSEIGASILAETHSPFLKMGQEIALSHHERWDGTGYPFGLAGEAIPFSAAIVALCDVYDALRSRRHYKPELPHDKTCEIITQGDGRTQPDHFHPDVLAIFKQQHDVFNAIFNTHADEPG